MKKKINALTNYPIVHYYWVECKQNQYKYRQKKCSFYVDYIIIVIIVIVICYCAIAVNKLSSSVNDSQINRIKNYVFLF